MCSSFAGVSMKALPTSHDDATKGKERGGRGMSDSANLNEGNAGMDVVAPGHDCENECEQCIRMHAWLSADIQSADSRYT